jgi:hypothetical protein
MSGFQTIIVQSAVGPAAQLTKPVQEIMNIVLSSLPNLNDSFNLINRNRFYR